MGERILVLTTSYPDGGNDSAGHFVRSEVTLLREEGHSVVVLAAGGPFDEGGVIALGDGALFSHPGALTRLRENPLRVWRLFRATVRIRRLLKDGVRFDRVVCHWLIPTAFPWGLRLADRGATFEAVAHGSDVRLLLRFPYPLRRFILEALFRAGFQLRFVSSELKSELLSSRLSPPVRRHIENALIRPSPIDCHGVPPKQDARTWLGLDPTEKWAVIVGRLIETKRVGLALAAADLVPDLRVAVIGDGPLYERLKSLFPTARFLGHLPRAEALRWISAADVLLSASRLEGAPTTIREALRLGTPVVASRSGDLEEWARVERDLWVVEGAQTSESRGSN